MFSPHQKYSLLGFFIILLACYRVHDTPIIRLDKTVKIHFKRLTPARVAQKVFTENSSHSNAETSESGISNAKSGDTLSAQGLTRSISLNSPSNMDRLESGLTNKYQQGVVDLNQMLLGFQKPKDSSFNYLIPTIKLSSLDDNSLPKKLLPIDDNLLPLSDTVLSRDQVFKRAENNKSNNHYTKNDGNQTLKALPSQNSKSPVQANYKSQGFLELKQGAALGPDRNIEVYWQDEKSNQRRLGQVSVGWDQAGYSVDVPYGAGQIVAKVHDQEGRTVAQGSIPWGGGEGMTIPIFPNQTTVSVKSLYPAAPINHQNRGDNRRGYSNANASRVSGKSNERNINNSSYAKRQKELVSKNENSKKKPASVAVVPFSDTEATGNIDEGLRSGLLARNVISDINPQSESVFYFESEGHLPLVSVISGQEQMELTQIPEDYAQALFTLFYQDQDKDEKLKTIKTLVLGQVRYQKKSQEGVKIEIESNISGAEVYYLDDSFMPNANAQGTLANGYFIILGLSEGMHSLKAHALGQTIGVTNVYVQKDISSSVNFEIQKNLLPQELFVFDAFDGSKQAALLSHQQIEFETLVNGHALQMVTPSSSASYVTAIPDLEGYLTATYIFSKKQNQIFVPLIKKQWLDYIKQVERVNASDDSATLIGFYQESVAAVSLAFQDEKYEILYFDQNGERVLRPVAGGGFLIFGVTPGRMDMVVAKQEEENLNDASLALWTQVISADQGETLVVSPKF